MNPPAMAKHDRVLCVDSTVVKLSLNTRTRNEMMMNIYVGNLPYGATEDELKTAFGTFGEVSSVNLITDKVTGQSKGFAFVEMAENASADAAIKGLNETSMGGRNLKVNQAKPRGERPSRSPRW
jgi:RNA recognition motif-containing protein